MLPGFTTREQVTQLSGRGVGMDVVHNEVRQLGGRISVDSAAGRGVTFTMHLPLSLSVMQALVVRVADQPFAIPVTSVVNILKVRPQDLPSGSNGDARFDHLGRSYPLMNLRERLGFPPPTVELEDKVPLILVRAGEHEVMLQIDALVNTQEIVVKPLGAQITELQGIEGATVLGDGSVVLILDVADLWLMQQATLPTGIGAAPEPAPAEQRRTVMVIDDSLTVRTVTERHLRKHGIEVVLAKDGVEALEKLRDLKPDVMLVDIEMPRMDGYELTSRVRENPDTAHIPIIIITSRAGAKHKQKAMDLGADRYLTKPYQEDVLMSEIEEVLAQRRVH
jgi:chemosensory pili system protein ChpA (sensor histidine kinase/response regulator)